MFCILIIAIILYFNHCENLTVFFLVLSVVLTQVLFSVLHFLQLYVNFSNFELYRILTYTPLLVLIQPNL